MDLSAARSVAILDLFAGFMFITVIICLNCLSPKENPGYGAGDSEMQLINMTQPDWENETAALPLGDASAAAFMFFIWFLQRSMIVYCGCLLISGAWAERISCKCCSCELGFGWREAVCWICEGCLQECVLIAWLRGRGSDPTQRVLRCQSIVSRDVPLVWQIFIKKKSLY